MPANQGRTPVNWKPRKEFQGVAPETNAMAHSDYTPGDAAAFSRFLQAYVPLPELLPYEHDMTGLASLCDYIAEEHYREGAMADELVKECSQPAAPAIESSLDRLTDQIVPIVFLATVTPLDTQRVSA